MKKIMIITYSIFFTAFFISCSSKKVCNTTKPTFNCSKDSIRVKEFFIFLKGKKELDVYSIERKILLGDNFSKTDGYCRLLVYASLFDFLIQKGINLKHKSGDITIHNIMLENASKEMLEQVKKDNLYIEERNIYLQFVELKAGANDIIMPMYKMDKTKSFEKDVDQIISSGLYQNPQQLKYMLMVDYKDLIAKVKKDMDKKN